MRRLECELLHTPREQAGAILSPFDSSAPGLAQPKRSASFVSLVTYAGQS